MSCTCSMPSVRTALHMYCVAACCTVLQQAVLCCSRPYCVATWGNGLQHVHGCNLRTVFMHRAACAMQHHGAGKVQPTASPFAILKVGASSTGAAEASAAMQPKLTFRRLYVVRLLHRVLLLVAGTAAFGHPQSRTSAR